MKLPGLHALRASIELLALVVADIVRSNIAVALIVLRPGTGTRKAGFLTIPLATRHPRSLAAMACIITATPGTCWVRYDAKADALTIHMLELVDEETWIRLFKKRYETRVMEIFE